MGDIKMNWLCEEHKLLPIVRMIGSITEGRDNLELILSSVILMKLAAENGRFYDETGPTFAEPQKGEIVVAFKLIFPNREEIKKFISRIQIMFP